MGKKLLPMLQGAIMGIGEMIPGVNGSNLAIVMGVYDDFINLLSDCSRLAQEVLFFVLGKSNYKKIKESFFKIKWEFGIKLVIGMILAIALLSNLIHTLRENYPNYVVDFFFGVVLASAFIPWKEIKRPNARHYIIAIVSFAIAFLLLGLKPNAVKDPSLPFLFLGGVIGITGLILPGISGSFILLVMGIYDYEVDIIKNLTRFEANLKDLQGLVVFVLGLTFGFLVFIRLFKIIFEKYTSELLACFFGIMLASLRVIWPFFESEIDSNGNEVRNIVSPTTYEFIDIIITIILVTVGFLMVYLLNKTTVDREQAKHITESS